MIRFNQSGDDLPAATVAEEDAGGWWINVYRAAVRAADPTVNISVYASDDGVASGVPIEEDYWWRSITAIQTWPLPPVRAVSDDGNDLGAMHASPSMWEEYWLTTFTAAPKLWPTPPVRALEDDGSSIGALGIGVTEDYWYRAAPELVRTENWSMRAPGAISTDGNDEGNLTPPVPSTGGGLNWIYRRRRGR